MTGILNGAIWSLSANVAVRAASLAAQVVLGMLLTREDFGVYGIALSLSALLSALSNGGTQQVLIKRWSEFDELAPKINFVALIFNVVSGALLVTLGWYWASAHDMQDLNQLI